MDESCKQSITRKLKPLVKMEENLADFYSLSQNNPIMQDVIKDLYGIHTIGRPKLFPELILAVTLEIAPMSAVLC